MKAQLAGVGEFIGDIDAFYLSIYFTCEQMKEREG
jgi:hypothetical protein